MANWIDFFALVLTLAVVGGVIYGILTISRQLTESVQSTKESLKNKGLHISGKGVSIKTSKRFDREDYVDATQRGFIKAMGASSFGRTDSTSGTPVSDRMSRQDSSSSIHSNGNSEDKKRKGMFKRGLSGSKEKI